MIKTFESFNDDTVQTVKDICLELEDEGYSVNHVTTKEEAGLLMLSFNFNSVTIRKRGTEGGVIRFYTFDYSDVSEVVDRLKEYLGSKIQSIRVRKIISNGDGVWVDLDRLKNEKIKGVSITYDKDI